MDGVTFLVLVCPVLLDRGGDSTRLGWLSLVLTCAAYDDKDEKAAWLRWFPSIPTWRVVCSLSLA